MKKACPVNTKRQCVWWEVSAISLLVFLAVYTVISHVMDWTSAKEVVVSVLATFSTLWCIWVVRTFRNIMTWWVDIRRRVDQAVDLMSETKRDIEEIKTIAKP